MLLMPDHRNHLCTAWFEQRLALGIDSFTLFCPNNIGSNTLAGNTLFIRKRLLIQ